MGLLLAFLFFFLRNNCKCSHKTYSYFKGKFLWNGTILFMYEGYMEIGICSMAVTNRWFWDP